jgi:serine/threonine protein kinase
MPPDAEPPEGFAAGDQLCDGIIAWACLGEGPHCATWAAWSIDRWSPVVVKVPLPDSDPDRALASLRREADKLGRLKHPAFSRLFEARLDPPEPLLVLELVEGRPLSKMLKTSRFSVGDTVRLGLQLSSALRYLHGLGIAHLDLKPHNIMMRGGRALIIDFGSAQNIGEAAPPGPRGTDGYMSPEQEAREPVSESMDLWSLGAVLYQTVSGRKAAERGGRESFRFRRAPARLRRLIDDLLEPDPAARPSSMSEVLNELARLERSPKRGWAPEIARPHLPVATSRADQARLPEAEAAQPPSFLAPSLR